MRHSTSLYALGAAAVVLVSAGAAAAQTGGFNIPASLKSEGVACTLAPTAAAEANETGWVAHRRRSLDEASAAYDRALQLAPAQALRPEQRDLVLRLAPVLLTTPTEPFRLMDVVAVVHPTQPWIAYHLLWEDDIDFPDDNDPSDHEVVWVRYDPERRDLVGYSTYFHGRVLAAPSKEVAEARRSGGRPKVAVQWGKHGTMPEAWRSQTIIADQGDLEAAYYPLGVPITVETYNRGIYRKLSTVGRHHLESPLGAGWPARFVGSWADFVRFDTAVDTRALLKTKSMMTVSFFNNAVLNRQFLRYNFRPKTEWPDAVCGR